MFSASPLLKSLDFFVFDISGNTVYILSCRKDRGDFSVTGHSRVRLPKKSIDNGNLADMRSIILTLERGMRQAARHLETLPTTAIFSVHALELFADHIGMTYAREEGDMPITMEELDEMMLHIERRALERSESKIVDRWGALPTSLKLSASLLTHITLDDTNLSNPLGFTGRLLQLNLLNIFCGSKYMNLLSTISRHLNLEVLSHLPAPLALSKWEQLLDYESYEGILFLDISSFTTSTTFMRDAQICEIATLPLGVTEIERVYKKQFPKIDSLSIERLIAGSPISQIDGECEYLSSQITLFATLMASMLEDMCIKHFSGLSHIRLFLSGAPIHPSFQEALKSELSHLLPQRVQLESIEELYGLMDGVSLHDSHLPAPYGVALGLALAGCDLVDFRDDPITSTLRRVIYQYA